MSPRSRRCDGHPPCCQPASTTPWSSPSLAASAGASAATRSNVRFGVRRVVLRVRRSLPVYPDEQTCGRPAGQAPCSAGSAPTNSNSVFVLLKENRVQSLSQILYGHRIRWNQLRSQVRGKRFDPLSPNECSLDVVFASTLVKVLQRLNQVIPLPAAWRAFNALKTSQKSVNSVRKISQASPARGIVVHHFITASNVFGTGVC